MKSEISADTRVFIFFNDQRGRIWVAGTDSRRNKFGDLILVPQLDDEARNAKPWRFEFAQVAARRFNTEGYLNPSIYKAKFALEASDSAEEQSFLFSESSVFQEDRREAMHYRGLVAHPGHSVEHGKCWYVKFPGLAIESIRGNTVEEAVDRTYERNLQSKAEQYVAPPEAPQQQPIKSGPRRRPGDLRFQ